MTDRNKSVEDLASSIDRLALEFLLPIQTAPNVSQTVFDMLYQSTKELTDALKGTPDVRKSLLHMLYSIIATMKAEIPYRKSDKALLESMTFKLEQCFSAILKDGGPPDY